MPTLRGFILGLICLTAVIAAGEWYARREFEQCSALLGEAPYEWGWIPSSRNYLDPPVNASRIYPDRNQQPNRVVYDELGFRAGTRTGTSSTGGLLCLGGETCLAPRLPQRYLFTDVWNELRTRAGFNGSIRNGSAPYGCPLLWQIQFAERILPAQPDQILIILGPESLDSDFRIRRAVQFDSNSQPVACVHPAFESVSAGKSSPLKDVGIPRLLLPGLINACWNQPQSEKQLKITDRKSTLSEARVHEMLQPLMELSNRCQENHIRLRVVYLPNATELLSLEN
ncbi:MAG: hypothetical protein KDA78_07175, partial [Planctomycetaceae bacterium]|nr:hypothetical protein [Planctomycetaceae bacterium]